MTAHRAHDALRGEALAGAAAAHGIAPDYEDIWGQRHRVSDATLARLLEAMGKHPGDDEQAPAAALCGIESGRDRKRVAPMVVLRENVRPWILHLRLPIELADRALDVRVTAEGGRLSTDASLSVLHRDSSRDDDGALCVDVEVALAATLPAGYHQVELLADAEIIARTCCAVAPAACFLPAQGQATRVWGAAVQLYGVRSDRNWGIGDFTDLATLVEQWGARGAGVVGVNPLHAMFPHEPRHASPYSPSSRLFHNTLYVDVEAVPDFRECEAALALVLAPQFQATLAALRAAPLVDYAGVADVKRQVFEFLYRHFRECHRAGGDARAQAFKAYVEGGGEALRRHALFEALLEHFQHSAGSAWGWQGWPAQYRDPASEAVTRFAAEHSERVEFYLYLQWQAEQQFSAVAAGARVASLSVGVLADLAVSIDRGGAEAWANQDLYALGAGVGAPPDAFNPIGQNWSLLPMIPSRLRDAAYAPFLATLRANMRHAGALRIDHVMALARLFWIPAGSPPSNGAYVQYPFADLLGLLALESHRHRCIVIGEDLGTVPDYVREAMSSNAILSYRVLLFEREANGEFKAPAAYPAEALVTASTHDLPTLAGWWAGDDIELRAAHGLLAASDDRIAQSAERQQDRRRLLGALERARLLPSGTDIDAASKTMDPPLARAVQAFLGATPSRLQLVQLEDVIGVRDQANLPGTIDSHPNWRRKLALPLERWPTDLRFDSLTAVLEHQRGPRKRRSKPRRATPLHVPRATYRVQLNHAFTFADATALVPYLAQLGISHVYCSPYLRARPGSLHGYDIVDHGTLNPEIGSRDDFERFVAALDAHGMGHLCDVVPNHVGVMGADNAWWMDVLENGPASACADYFDIDWAPLDADIAGRVLVPVLGDPYGAVLERGELKLAFEPEPGTFAVTYSEHRFPIDPREYPALLRPALQRAADRLTPDAAAAVTNLVDRLRALPARAAIDTAAHRQRDSATLKRDLSQLAARHPPLSAAIAQVVTEFNGQPGRAETFERLHALLEAQAFRLAYWRVASDEINYRRFFDINDLAALRMENESVFDATHSFILKLAAAGKIHGLRIDHPDGLHDPARYFEQLQARYRQYVTEAGAPGGTDVAPIYVVLEKITASHEHMPERWPVSGTTGYRFANVVNGLFVAGASKARLDRV
ncbi:MAG: 4-alpha-glucanotransferase, partial [Burkholderiaceae bacterium]